MIRNFFVVAVRNLLKQRTQSILNVAGLAIGLACSIYVYLYAFDELTYDTQHPDPENTYRLLSKEAGPEGQDYINAWTLLGWAHYMKENLKDVRGYTSLNPMGWPHSFYYTPEKGEQRIVLSENVLFAEENYADFFYLDLIAGDKDKLFEHPTDILISETAARELFGDENALDKQLEFSHPFYLDNTKTSVIVKGIFRDMPYNMQLGRTTKYLLNRELQKVPFERWNPEESFENTLTSMWWPAYGGYIYFQTEPGADLDFLREKLKIEINKAASAKLNKPTSIEPVFLKITDTHFSDVRSLIWPEMQGNRQYIYIFLTIGVFILLISCMNYTNLATARSMRRAKEVGMRKAMGSYKRQLVFQFLQESFLVTGISILLAMIIAVVLLPYFRDFSNKDFSVYDIFSIHCLSAIAFLWIVVSILSGLYPAFYIASLQTMKVLRGGTHSGKGAHALRQGLMVFQFSISLVLIVFTLVVITQMNEMINNDLNKAGDQIMSIRYGNSAPVNRLNAFRNELARVPGLSVSSFGNHLPRREGYTDLSFEVSLPDKNDQKYTWDMMCVGPDFHKVYDLELIAGRFFDHTAAIDSTEVLVNEEVSRQLNVRAEELIGQQITVAHTWTKKQYYFKIRGVLKDFKYKSVHNKIAPLILSVQKTGPMTLFTMSSCPKVMLRKT
jgi:putative ABC transport system permease protein